MFKRLEAWIVKIIRTELTRVENAAKIEAQKADEEAAKVIDDLKKHVTDEIAKVSHEIAKVADPLKVSVADEINKRFDLIIKNTGVAAREALADARRLVRMPCEACGLMSWKFTVTEEGKVRCHDCKLKGAK